MIKKIIIFVLSLLLLFIIFFFVGKSPVKEEPKWGTTFSIKYAEDLNLDWKETYLALIHDLNVKKIRIPFYWDLIEKEKDLYDFENTDWILNEALKKEVEVIPVIGIKVPRWPECHIPEWAKEFSQEEQQKEVLNLIQETVLRYKNYENVTYWQIENEPFLDFGNCPWYDKSFLLKEIELVRNLDSETPILVSESGELSTWFPASKVADIVGTTMYRQTWWHRAGGFYFKYPITPVHYYRKSLLVDWFFDKRVVCVELQAEPWGPAPTYVISLEQQEESMNLEKFKENIEYARKTGLPEFYLWGAEWWYWMKKTHNQPEFWEEAKSLFN